MKLKKIRRDLLKEIHVSFGYIKENKNHNDVRTDGKKENLKLTQIFSIYSPFSAAEWNKHINEAKYAKKKPPVSTRQSFIYRLV